MANWPEMRDDVIVVPIGSLRRVLAAALALAVVVVLLGIAWQQRDRLPVGGLLTRGIGDQIDRSTYQAVFLVGDQVYFGKLATHGDDYLLLDDVFYLPPDSTQAGDEGKLVKRGNELHGPREPMIIPVHEVLFIENLRLDSSVVTAITRYHAGAPGATTAPATGTARPPATATAPASPTR